MVSFLKFIASAAVFFVISFSTAIAEEQGSHAAATDHSEYQEEPTQTAHREVASNNTLSHAKPKTSNTSTWVYFLISAFLLVGVFLSKNTMLAYLGRKTFNFRIYVLLALAFVPFLGTSLYSVFSMQSVSVEIDEIAELNIPLIKQVSAISIHPLDQALTIERFIRKKSQKDARHFVELGHKVEKELKSAEVFLNNYIANASRPVHQDEFKKQLQELSDIKAEHRSYEKHGEELIQLSQSNPSDSKFSYLEARFEKEQTSLDSHIQNFLFKIEERTEVAAKTAEQHEHQAIRTIIALFLLSAFTGLFISYFIRRDIVDGLKDTNLKLQDNIAQVVTMSTQLDDISNTLSAATTEQAAALQETVIASDEISSTVNRNTEAAGTSLTASEDSYQKAGKGQEQLEQLNHAIEGVQSSNVAFESKLNENTNSLEDIVRAIKEIEQKTQVINEIVFQTKLLSFNASVEAARAGEHGKGFAVVAEEVGNLAQMSGRAAKEISNLIESSTGKVTEIVEKSKTEINQLTEKNSSDIQEVSGLSKTSFEIFQEIYDSLKNVKVLNEQIALGSKEQALGVSEISKAINEVQQTTLTNEEMSRNLADSAGLLNDGVRSLETISLNINALILGSTALNETETAFTEDKKETYFPKAA